MSGDTVLISGLYGDEVKFANNILGYIRQIVTIGGLDFNFAAYIQLDNRIGGFVPINFLYLYNLKTLTSVDNILTDNTFMSRYLKAKKSVHNGFMTGSD